MGNAGNGRRGRDGLAPASADPSMSGSRGIPAPFAQPDPSVEGREYRERDRLVHWAPLDYTPCPRAYRRTSQGPILKRVDVVRPGAGAEFHGVPPRGGA